MPARGAQAYSRDQSRDRGQGRYVISNSGREAGQMVEYLHFHIIPRHPGDAISFYKLGAEQTPEQLAEMAAKIKAQL